MNNEYRRRDDGTIEIMLAKGKIALIDVGDLDVVATYDHWDTDPSRNDLCYARSSRHSKQPRIYMHRLLLSLGPREYADHINHNGLDNRRCNLRLCTPVQNTHNSRPMRGKGFKGVCFYEPTARWRVKITSDGKLKELGYFSTAIEAARAYDDAARILFGSFAYLNFPDGDINMR